MLLLLPLQKLLQQLPLLPLQKMLLPPLQKKLLPLEMLPLQKLLRLRKLLPLQKLLQRVIVLCLCWQQWQPLWRQRCQDTLQWVHEVN